MGALGRAMTVLPPEELSLKGVAALWEGLGLQVSDGAPCDPSPVSTLGTSALRVVTFCGWDEVTHRPWLHRGNKEHLFGPLMGSALCTPLGWFHLYPFPVINPSLGELPNPGIEPSSPTLQADSLPAELPGKPKNTGVGSLSLLQWIFPTQGLNPVLRHCRQILYQLSYQGSAVINPNHDYICFLWVLWVLLANYWGGLGVTLNLQLSEVRVLFWGTVLIVQLVLKAL